MKLVIRVALDVMGGDHAPKQIIAGGLLALTELADLHIHFVGPQAVLENYLRDKVYDQNRVALMPAEEIIKNEDSPVLAVRRKKNSSMMVALQMLRDKKVEAMVSAGNTGALMAGSLLLTGRIEGIERPALTVVAPTFPGGNVVLLDVGANMDAKAEQLLQYGIMGKIYAREVLLKKEPRVGLLNVGVEEIKGNEQVKKAYQLMKEKLPCFIGNVEARNVLDGVADVIICDGFSGNIILKTLEGLVAGLFGSLKEAMSANLKSKIAASLLKPELLALKAKLDYTEYGGAPFLGVGGACIKGHGSSNARAIRSAIVNQAYLYARQNVNGLIEQELAALLTD
ncbi:MAG TPA: phosphate acyltransferase PlsX [Oscillospiraceae bacterium]|nr:phosphate acyltransferase PlsX [Oscillospiraceae bacterium]